MVAATHREDTTPCHSRMRRTGLRPGMRAARRDNLLLQCRAIVGPVKDRMHVRQFRIHAVPGLERDPVAITILPGDESFVAADLRTKESERLAHAHLLHG